jgi:hypothetical protein
MKYLIDIKGAQAPSLLGLLRMMPNVRVLPLAPEKVRLLSDVREAVSELREVRAGTRRARPLLEFLHGVPSPRPQRV